jgi:hypothetical protein
VEIEVRLLQVVLQGSEAMVEADFESQLQPIDGRASLLPAGYEYALLLVVVEVAHVASLAVAEFLFPIEVDIGPVLDQKIALSGVGRSQYLVLFVSC